MKKSRIYAGALAVMLTVTIVGTTIVKAHEEYYLAPDGKTVAAETVAAADGAYKIWQEKWQDISKDWTQVSLTPGQSESCMNFAWYSKNGEAVSFKYGKSSDLSDGITVSPAQNEISQKDASGVAYTSNKISLENLEANTTYYYQVDKKEIVSFKTRDSSNFSFIFVGDPQIGSSCEMRATGNLSDEFYNAQYDSVENDAFNWNNTLSEAIKKCDNNAAFIMSAGDQIQTNVKDYDYTVSEIEYVGYLSPSVLKSIPVATTVGNHDADNPNYLNHFNLPNLSELGSNGIVGGDYYFRYGNALFIMLNTQDTNIAEHKEFIKNTVEANSDAKWRIVTLHQDIYGSAEHSNEPEIVNLRYSLVPIFQEYDVDVVLTGHDHAYSRSQLLKDGLKDISDYSLDAFFEQFEKDVNVGKEGEEVQIFTSPANINDNTRDEDEKTYIDYLYKIMDADAVVEATKNQDIAVDPEGILYMTAGSSSGSKYYDLVARQQAYIAARWQEDVPTYSVIEIDETSFVINTYRTDNNQPIDKQFTIVKSADKTVLSEEIKAIESKQLSETVYTEESWKIYMAALNGAYNVVADATADTQTINNALAALKSAFWGLVNREDASNTSDVKAINEEAHIIGKNNLALLCSILCVVAIGIAFAVYLLKKYGLKKK